MSGRPEAAAVLEELEARARDDPAGTEELRTQVREAQEFCDRVMREGPDRVFDRDAAP
jgi:hypothetical protein